MVDAYYGPPDLAAEVDAEPPVDPRALVDDAAELLAALEDGWLRDQVAGLWTNARALSGEAMAYADEVEGCYGVRPTLTDEEAFATAHERLEELLAGDGPLPERYQRWQASIRVPPQQLEHTLAAVIEEARAWTRGLVELPDGEGVVLEIVTTSRGWPFAATAGTSAAQSRSTSTSRSRASRRLCSRVTRRTPATTWSAAARKMCSCMAAGSSRRRS